MNQNYDFYIVTQYENETEINNFDCGYQVFNDYLKYKFLDDKAVIHYVINADDDTLMAYFSLTASGMLFSVNSKKSGVIPAIELKMFAIDKKYRGVRLSETLKLSGKMLKWIYAIIKDYTLRYVGAKALILYAVPAVVKMYEKEGFIQMPGNSSMYEYKSLFNDGCIAMYKFIEF